MLDNGTKQRIDSARDILVGKIPSPQAQVEQITIALIYKFMDDMDQESLEMGGNASFFTGEFEKYAWSKMFDPRLGGYDLLALYSEAITRMNENPGAPQLFRDIFKNAYLPYRDPETLKLFLKVINEFHYDHSERLGDAFEYLLSVLSSQGDAGQFRTPRHIIEFMVQVVDPKKNETVLDPACGTAGFLISSYKHIRQANTAKTLGDLFTVDERKRMVENFKGYDISPDMVRLSLVNMYLHGFVSPQIYEYDTLTSEDRWHEYADVILANPPFMSPTGGIRPHKNFSVQSKRSEVLFVDYMAEHLTPNGRAAIIVPEGIIFQSGTAYKQLRKYLVEKDFLWAVVSLPAGVFNPYAGVKTSILFLDKVLAKKTDKILFVKVENDGFGLGAQRREIGKNDLPKALELMKSWQRSVNDGSEIILDENCLLVHKEELAENGEYNLTGQRYFEKIQKTQTKYPFIKLEKLCEKISDNVDPSSFSGEVNYIGLENIESNKGNLIGEITSSYEVIKSAKTRFNKGDVLYGKLRPNLNKVFLANISGICSTDIYVLRHKENTDKRFLYEILRSQIFNSKVLVGLGGAQLPRVNFEFMKNLEIPLPSIDEQGEIVAEIESYQRIIDGARMVVENWKPNIELELEEARKEAGVDAWEMVKLGDVCEVLSGQSPEGKYYNEIGEGLPFYQGKIEFTNTYIGEPKKWTTQITKIAEKGDILMSVRAPVGPINIATQKICIGRGLAAIRPHKSEISLMFLFYFIRSKEKEITGNSGAVFPSINRSAIEKIQLPHLPIELQKKIESNIDYESSVIESNKKMIFLLEEKIRKVINRVWGD
ncbi:MAG: N-6 DNA methylase [Chloroflexi bacterium HGW-Chloroflexi-8]|nr:MAG: N-6 DNA methylase [Chloroflexi bacterium HGW-Chloroflexi-8]